MSAHTCFLCQLLQTQQYIPFINIKQQMKDSLEVIRQIAKNQTYQSIRFNDHQISEENIRQALNKFFPKLLSEDKKLDIQFLLKALKDESIFKNVKNLISSYLEIIDKLEELQLKLQENSKFEQSDQKDVTIIEPSKKKITRASIAKRNQETQEQLRKDQIYVRLTPKSQGCLQWMLCNRNFPRIQCKLSCNQHLQYLVAYLSNKWLRGKVGHKIVLYPDMTTFLKNSPVQERQKVIREPLNNYFMFTDIMTGCGVSQNGSLNLNYEITQIKKINSNSKGSNIIANTEGQRIDSQITQKNINQNISNNHDNFLTGVSRKKHQQIKKGHLNLQSSNHKHMKHANNNNSLSNMNNFGANPHHPSQQNLSNLSNIFQNHGKNNNYYHEEQSLFKSIGFFGLGNNSIAFGNKNTDNILSVNSNSFFDLQNNLRDFGQKQKERSRNSEQKLFQQKKQVIIIDQQLKNEINQNDNNRNQNISKSGEKKTNNNEKLDYLRNAITLLQKEEGLGFGDNKNESLLSQDQQSQHSQTKLMGIVKPLNVVKQVKTVNIKKKNP